MSGVLYFPTSWSDAGTSTSPNLFCWVREENECEWQDLLSWIIRHLGRKQPTHRQYLLGQRIARYKASRLDHNPRELIDLMMYWKTLTVTDSYTRHKTMSGTDGSWILASAIWSSSGCLKCNRMWHWGIGYHSLGILSFALASSNNSLVPIEHWHQLISCFIDTCCALHWYHLRRCFQYLLLSFVTHPG